MKNSIIYIALALITATSCQNETTPDTYSYPEDGSVNILTNVNELVTRSDNSTAYTGSDLSLTLHYGTSDPFTSMNTKWTNSNSAWSSTKKTIWKNPYTPLHVFAYAPHQESSSDFTMEEIPVSVHTDQSEDESFTASDFMVFHSKEFTPNIHLTEGQISVLLNHILSHVDLQISYGSEFSTPPTITDLKIMAITSATYNATSNELNSSSSEPVAVTPSMVSANNYRAIVVPSSMNTGDKFLEMMVDGQNYTYNLSQDHTFEPGKSYTFSLKLGDDQIELEDNGITVKNWGRNQYLVGGDLTPPTM